MSDELPPGWAWATPDEVAASVPNALTIGPFGSDLKVADYREAGIPLVFVREIRAGRFGDAKTKFVDERKAAALARHYVRPGDVLITKMGDPPGDIAIYPLERPPAIITADCVKLTPNLSVTTPGYLVNCLRSEAVRSQITERAAGVAQQKISLERFRTVRIPLAPLAEQIRIADKLDALLARVDVCREHLDRVPGILKRFRQSVLAAATSGELTRAWREERGLSDDGVTTTLGGIGAVSGGITKNSGRANAPLQKKYLRVANVYANRLELADIATIGTTTEEFARTVLQSGDVLIVEGNGSIDQIGRAALWRGQIAECAHQNHLIRWRSSGAVLPEFALYWLLSPFGRSALVNFAKSTTGLHTLSLSKVSAIPIRYPVIDEQREVVRRVDELFSFGHALEARLRAAIVLVEQSAPALLAKAFRGELVPQDPSDERASELLARLAGASEEPAPRREPKRPRRKAS